MDFREKIRTQKLIPGIIVTMSLPSVSEMLSGCGYDWLWIDMEHAPLSLREVQGLAQAKNPKCTALVRVPTNSDEWIKRTLDLGVEGIIIPHVSNAQEAKKAITASYYPPQGDRGAGLGRANGYGMNGRYKDEANAKRLLFIQVEDREGVENIGEIAQLQGVDGVIIGPYDLSGSYGKFGEVWDPEVVEGIKRVLKGCLEHKMPIGIFAKTAEDAKKYAAMGFRLIAIGIDAHTFWSAAKATLDALSS